MQGFLEKEILVAASYCDQNKKMMLPCVFTLFHDIAGEHAKKLGIGEWDMEKKGLFWLTVRTKVRVHHYPMIEDEVILRTWLGEEEGNSVRSNRYYLLLDADRNVLAEGKTEWAVFSFANQQLVRIKDAKIPPVERLPEKVPSEPFSRFPSSFAEEHQVFSHVVVPSEVDAGHHMNNCAYMRALYDTFTTKEAGAVNIKEAEIVFRTPCLGDEALKIRRMDHDTDSLFIVEKEDGKTAAMAKMVKA